MLAFLRGFCRHEVVYSHAQSGTLKHDALRGHGALGAEANDVALLRVELLGLRRAAPFRIRLTPFDRPQLRAVPFDEVRTRPCVAIGAVDPKSSSECVSMLFVFVY